MENGKIYDAESAELLVKSFSECGVDVLKKGKTILDSNTIAQGGMYLEQQLRVVMPRILAQVIPDLSLLRFITVDNSGGLGQTIIQRAESFNGEFKEVNEIASNKGVITVNRNAKELQIKEYEAESAYSDTDIRRSIVYGENLDTSLMYANDRIYRQFLDKVGYIGLPDNKDNIVNPGISKLDAVINPANILTSANTFANLSGLEIYAEIETLYNKMFGLAGGSSELIPNVVVVPPKQFSRLTTGLPVGTAPQLAVSLTVKNLIETNLGIKIYSSKNLEGAGVSDSDRLIMLNNSRDNLSFILPEPLHFAPVFIKNFHYTIASKCRVAGISFNRREALGYLDGI